MDAQDPVPPECDKCNDYGAVPGPPEMEDGVIVKMSTWVDCPSCTHRVEPEVWSGQGDALSLPTHIFICVIISLLRSYDPLYVHVRTAEPLALLVKN